MFRLFVGILVGVIHAVRSEYKLWRHDAFKVRKGDREKHIRFQRLDNLLQR